MRLKKGDMVKVLTGKDAGRQGRILKVLHKRRMVVVDSINVYKKHMKGDGKQKQSGIIDIAKPVDISNVMLVCPSCGKSSRVGFEMKDGAKVRICKKCSKPLESKTAKKKEEDKKDETSKGGKRKSRSSTKKDSTASKTKKKSTSQSTTRKTSSKSATAQKKSKKSTTKK